MEVVTDEALCEQVGLITATKKHVVVTADQIKVITRVLYLVLSVHIERYL